MEALSVMLEEKRSHEQKPDPDTFRAWRDNKCTQWHLAELRIMHQEVLEKLSQYISESTEDELRALHKFQGAAENLELIIDDIEGFYYGGEDNV